METLVHYIVIENNLNKDSNIRVWLLMGNIVQIGKFPSDPLGLGSAKKGLGSHSHGLPSRPSALQVLIPIPRRDETPDVGYDILARHRIRNPNGPSE